MREGEERVPFRVEVVLGRGRFGGWAEMAPPSPFLFFLFSLLFYFCFLISFLDFAYKIQIKPNQFKPLSEIFKNQHNA
jgi:hypothetical protein